MKRKWLVAGLLVLVELVLCGGMVTIIQAAVSQSDVQWYVFHFDQVSAETVQEQNFVVDGPVSLMIDNSNGQVNIQTGSDGQVGLTVRKQAWGQSQSEAQAAVAALRMDITQNGNTITIKNVEQQQVVVVGSYRTPTIDLTLTVPVSTSVTSHVRSGRLALSGTSGNAELTAERSPLQVSSVNGNLVLHAEYGDVTAEHITGTVRAESTRGSIRLTDIQSESVVRVTGDYGAIQLDAVRAGSLDLRSNRGDVIVTSSTLQGQVQVHSEYGSIALTLVDATGYDLSSNRGNISIDGARASLVAQSDYGRIDIKNGRDANLTLKSNRGSIQYAGSLGQGPHLLQAEYGDVVITLAQNAALSIDLKTTHGKIHSELPVTLNGSVTANEWRGSINGGGAQLTATSNNGSIDLKTVKP